MTTSAMLKAMEKRISALERILLRWKLQHWTATDAKRYDADLKRKKAAKRKRHLK